MSDEMKRMYLKGEVATKNISLKASRPISVTNIETVPIGNKATFKILSEGDENRAEFLTEVKLGEEYPARPSPDMELVLTEKWARSFSKAINENPKPLYRGGHEDAGINSKMRATPAGYVVGAMVADGSLFLRNYYRKGETPEQIANRNQDMTELKAGILSTSTGDHTEYKVDFDDKLKKYTYKADKSIGGQSNAIVEAHMTGASAEVKQTTFKGGNAEDENKNRRTSNMDEITNIEMFSRLKNQFTAGTVSIDEIEKGFDVIVLKQADKENLKRLEDAEKVLGNINEYLKGVEKEKAEVFVSLKDASLVAKFADEGIRKAAAKFFTLKEGTKEEIDAHVNEISEMEVITEIVGLKAAAINHKPGGDSTPAGTRRGIINA